MFNEHSGLVQTWVRLIQHKIYSRELVPDIANLREVVYEILDRNTEEAPADVLPTE